MTAVRAALAVALAVALLAVAQAQAQAQMQAQDPATYPAGIRSVAHTPVRAGSDFQVAVEVDGAAESVAVYVCSFASAQAEAPEVCYMPLGARRSGAVWTASTSAVDHPSWRDGAALGYKVMARTASGDLHAPDRTVADGEYDYYRVVVGQDSAAAPQGSAVVEDGLPGQAGAGDAADSAPVAPPAAEKGAPAPAAAWLLLGLGATALRRR